MKAVVYLGPKHLEVKDLDLPVIQQDEVLLKVSLIIGAGAIGLLTLEILKAVGHGPIVVVDKLEEKLKIAQALGADEVCFPEELNSAYLMNKFLLKGTNTIFECVGIEVTRNLSIELINTGGTIMLVGLGHNSSNLPVNSVIHQEITLKGAYSYTRQDFNKALYILQAGKISLKGWTTEVPLAEAEKAFQQLDKREIVESKIFLV